ncbi:unnamed protein product [Parnassius apollo]|uniref:(apollo) hypothetical protein n=1 Tax=Parnassius apollo TaxID=110799 RepID=A0A8S3Y0I3_PARAO|nr:unnamed protein product [Parnassius apollo]
MCYICNCLAWSLDIVQRAITFCLTCVLICIICIGLTICIIAGVAYGYNYSLAEFITFTRSDVTVYMRRGQMNDRPDLAQFGQRRMNDESETIANVSTDYQDNEPSSGEKIPLSDTWVKSQDARKYAERLTKFSDTKSSKSDIEEEEQGSVSYYRFTTPPIHRISIVPNPAIPTTVWQSGSSEIVMRRFPPMKDITSNLKTSDPDDYFYKVSDVDDKDKIKSKMKINRDEAEQSDDKSNPGDISTRHSIPMRHFEGSATEMDDENMSYKPV